MATIDPTRTWGPVEYEEVYTVDDGFAGIADRPLSPADILGPGGS